MNRRLKSVLAGACMSAIVCLSAQAAFVNLNTGIDVNSPPGVDDNWKLVSVDPATPPLPAPLNLPNAYITTPANGSPYSPWLANNAVSKWITYSPELYGGGDTTRDFTYRLVFFTTGGDTPVRWASDNTSTMYLDSVSVGTHSVSTFTTWMTTSLNLSYGVHTLDLVVRNIGQSSGNPTGARVEFTAGVAVPEPTTIIAGALLLLPFGLTTLRNLRKRT